MVKGRVKDNSYLTVDEIMDATDGGYSVYKYYLGKIHRIMSRPWGKQENHPSWSLFYRRNVWFWKDHASEETGNAIHFLQRYYNLTFLEAVTKISHDFGLAKVGNVIPRSSKITWAPPTEEEKKDYVLIDFKEQPFQKHHHKFWNIAGVTEVDCRQKDCYAVKRLAINRINIPLRSDETVFVFYAREEQSMKVYFPDRARDKRFRNNVPFHYLWNYRNIESPEKLIIQKSPKDMIVTSILTPNVIATQNESINVFDDETVARILDKSKNPIIWYGSDEDGVKKCTAVTNKLGWGYVNTPKILLPQINDAYGYAARFGLEGLEEFMKLKNLI